MKTASKIEMDFARAKKHANEIDEIAGDLTNVYKRDMDQTMGDIAASWKGDSACAYLNKAEKLQNEMKKTAEDLREIAAAIRTMAQNTYNAEMEALRIATQRDGGGGFR